MSDDSAELGNNLDPLDHDNNGKKGGSLKGAASTRSKGARKSRVEGDDKRTWIVLEDNPDIPPTGLPLGHNGNTYIIMPGEPVHAPDFLLEVLDHAVMSTPLIDGNTKQVIGHRERHRFPYRRVAAPSDAE